MRTKISQDNPYKVSKGWVLRYAYAYEQIPNGCHRHLDIGCNDGKFLENICNKVEEAYGVDVDSKAIARAKSKGCKVKFQLLQQKNVIPFADGFFQSVSILDVLEHIEHPLDMLKECCRVLRHDGILILTVPGKHLFSFMDIGNLKFRFPNMHKVYYVRKHGISSYNSKFVNNPYGLIGDIDKSAGWHRHFTRSEILTLLDRAGFVPSNIDGANLFFRPIISLEIIFGGVPICSKILFKLLAADSSLFTRGNIYIKAKKKHIYKTKKNQIFVNPIRHRQFG